MTMITPGQVAELLEHLRTCHGQVRISASEATDASFLLALHHIVREQNPDEDGPACLPYTHRASPDTVGEAYQILGAVTAHAARGALSQGLSPEDVAAELHALADAIDGTTDVAESMYAIPQIPRRTWESIGVDFSEAE